MTPRGKTPAWREGLSRNTLLLAAASLFSDISTEMLYPVLPIFLSQTLGAGGSIIGLIEGLAQGAQNIIQGVSGSLSDRLGRRKPIALVGYAMSALSKPFIGASASWAGVLTFRGADRLGAGIRAAPRDALLAASADEAHRGKAFGLESAGDNAGAFIGPLIAVALITGLALDLRWIFYLAIVPGVLAFLMVLLVREEPTAPRIKAKAAVAGLSRFPPSYGRYLTAVAVFGLGNSSNAFLILRTRELGASLADTILIYAGFNLLAALASYPAGALSDRLGRRNVLLAAFILYASSYLGFALSGGTLVVALLFGLYGVSQGAFRAVGKALAVDLSPPSLRGSGVGWYSAVVGVTGLIASLGAGVLWDSLGHASVFFVGAGAAAVGALTLLLLTPARPKLPAEETR